METRETAPDGEMTMAGRKRRRAIPIVDARFQWKYTLVITALGVGITAIMGGFLYRAHVDNTRLLDLDGSPALQQEVMRGDQIFLLYLVIFVLVMAVALALWGLVVTHRISGPVHILSRYLGELADGHYPDLRPLRKRDELRGFYFALEDAVSMLRERDTATLSTLEAAIDKARTAQGGDAKAGLAQVMNTLEGLRAPLVATLRQHEPDEG